MPLVRTQIDLGDVVKIMHSRGYGDHHDKRYALAFNKIDPGKKWKTTGEYRRVPAGGGVSKQQLSVILGHSETALEAANRIEAVITGAEMLPIETAQAPPGVDTAVMEKMVENRTDSQIGRHLSPVLDVLSKLTDRLEAIEGTITKLSTPADAPKKRGRPKGKKNNPDREIPEIDFGPRAKEAE